MGEKLHQLFIIHQRSDFILHYSLKARPLGDARGQTRSVGGVGGRASRVGTVCTVCKPLGAAHLICGLPQQSRRRRVCNPQLVAVWNQGEALYGIITKWCMESIRRKNTRWRVISKRSEPASSLVNERAQIAPRAFRLWRNKAQRAAVLTASEQGVCHTPAAIPYSLTRDYIPILRIG